MHDHDRAHDHEGVGGRLLFAGAVVVQLLVLYWPGPVDGGGVPGLDKAVHLAVFAAAALTGRRAGVRAVVLAVGLGLHAVASEAIQGTVLDGRSADPYDVLADLLGIAIGLAVARRPAR